MHCACMLSCASFFAIPCTVAHQVPLSMEFFRQEYWSRLLFSTPGDLPDPEIELTSLVSPYWQVDSLPLASLEKALDIRDVK